MLLLLGLWPTNLKTLMIKIFLCTFLLLFGCEFRPPSYHFASDIEPSKCKYPAPNVHYYNRTYFEIVRCKYDSQQRVSFEDIFVGSSKTLYRGVVYNYYRTFYTKTIYEYLNGNKDDFYIVDTQYISTE
jgi:hypothetical protein